MKIKYTGDIKDLTMFGYDFSKGSCEVDSEHFQNKLLNIPEFKQARVRKNDTSRTKDQSTTED